MRTTQKLQMENTRLRNLIHTEGLKQKIFETDLQKLSRSLEELAKAITKGADNDGKS